MSGKVMTVIGAVILVVIGLVMAPLVFDQVHDTQADPKQETFSVTTATGETSADVVTAEEHFHKDSCTHITITSDNAADSPTCSSYTSATKTLTVGGLAEATSRTLTVTYEIDALANYPGSRAIAGLIPLLYIVGILGLAGAMTWRAVA